MSRRCMGNGLLVLLTSCLPLGTVQAQTDQQAQHVARYLSGQRTLVTYREGGSVYGTYVFLEIHFCASGEYLLSGQSRKQTVLGNEQVNNWSDSGRWDVMSSQGQVRLAYFSTSGRRDVVPVYLDHNGGIRTDGASVQRQGRAQCR
jgi:hypothetical protein